MLQGVAVDEMSFKMPKSRRDQEHSLLESTDICKSSSQGENKGQSNIKYEPSEITNPSGKSTLNIWDVLELPDPPKILSASEARSQVEGLIKPTPVVLTLPQQLSKDLNPKHLQYSCFIEWCNAILFKDIVTKQLHLVQQGISPGSSTVIDKHLSSPPNGPVLTTFPREHTEEGINPPFVESCSISDEKSHTKPLDKPAFHPTSQTPQFKQPFTIKDLKSCNYVIMASKQDEDTKLFDVNTESMSQPTIKEIPINKIITVGEMEVSKYGVFDCINLLVSVLGAFEDDELLLQSETACATSQVNVEKNIMACIDTLVSFSGGNFKRDKCQTRSNKGNIFVDAKEKYNALFDSTNKKAHKYLSNDFKYDLQKPLPIPIPDKSKWSSPNIAKRNVSTQVKCTADITNNPIPIPSIIVTKPRCPSPCPSPLPSPNLFGKFQGGLKYNDVNGTKPNIDSSTPFNEGENATTETQSQDKSKNTGIEKMVNNHHSNEATPGYVNNAVFTDNPDSRLNKNSLATFSPKVSKRLKEFVKLPAMKVKFHDDSSSPYELPKSMIPTGTTKSLSTSNLNDIRPTIPSYGEVDTDTISVNSITTVTDEIVFTDFTHQNPLGAKQQATKISPQYWISNHPTTDVKEGPFRTLLRKMAKPFKKSPIVEKTNMPSKGFEVKPEIDKTTQTGEITESEQLDVAANNQELFSPCGRSLKVHLAEQRKRRNEIFQSWLDNHNKKLQTQVQMRFRYKRSQSNPAKKKSDEEEGFEDLVETMV